ncbi:hypothetical protein BJX62DRAFT_115041 [Aspergillus germanicus]
MTDIAESMRSVGRYFAEQKALTRGLLQSQRDLEEVLKLWVAEKRDPQIPLGSLKPVWEIMSIEGLQDIDELEEYFDRTLFDPRLENVHFAPLPHTVATYLIEHMLVRPWDQKSREEAMQAERGEVQRDKIRIIRDSFLWLRDLLGFVGTWGKELFPTHDVNSDLQRESAIRQKLSWLQNEEPKSFLQKSYSRTSLDEEDESKINDLWNIFAGSHSLSVKYAFCLAQLGAKGSWEPNGDGGRVSDEWYEYNQVISGLLVCKDRYSSKQ